MLYRMTDTAYRDGRPAPSAADPDSQITPALRKLAMVVMIGTFVVQMDATMVNVALNTMRADFHTTVSGIQWISTGYLLSMAMVIPLAGWATDRFAAKRTWMAALLGFLICSVLCGLAWSTGSMIVFRVLQGLCGGTLVPLSQAILAQAAGPKRMGRRMAMVGIPALLGPVVGPIAGGVLVDALGWHWIFYVNAPICLFTAVLSWRIVTDLVPPLRTRLDVAGLALLSPALAGIVYGLSQAGRHGSFADRHALIPVLVGIALLVGFVLRALRSSVDPIIDLRLPRSRSFAAASLMLFLIVAGLFGTMLLLPMYYQTVRAESVLRAGLLLAPQGIGSAIGIGLTGRLVDRFNPRPIAVIGVIMVAAGRIGWTQVGSDTSTLLLSLALAISGAGFGAVMVSAMTVAYQGLAVEAIPRATSAIRVFQQVGASFGVALLAVALQRRATAATDLVALAHAYGNAIWWSVAFTAAALIPALLLAGGRAAAKLDAGSTLRR